MDWSRYANQLRPLTARDFAVSNAVESEMLEEVARAQDREAARAASVKCCEVCGDPMHRGGAGVPDEDDEGRRRCRH
jgi:hypothetical protein